MNRKIKFRILDKITLKTEVVLLDNDFSCGKDWLKNKELIQFTGFQDKTGTDIYEKDLVKLYHKGEWVECEIIWNPKGMWSLKWKDGYINNWPLNPDNIEVVGIDK